VRNSTPIQNYKKKKKIEDNFTEMQKTYFKNPVPAVGVTVHGLIREIEYDVSESVR
jgi:hypothetical protein